MSNSYKIHFDSAEVKYLIKKTGCKDPHEAVEVFSKIIKEEKIDPRKMHEYLNRLMEKDGA